MARAGFFKYIHWNGTFIFLSTLVIAALFSLPGGPFSSWAQEVSLSPMQPGPTREGEKKEQQVAEKIWLNHKQLLREGEWEKSQGELEQLYQWKLNQGIRNHYSYAIALMRESQQIAGEGKPKAIPGLLDYAGKMAPDFSQVAYARALWVWFQNPFSLENVIKVIWHGIQGVFLSFYNLEEALSQLANFSLWILLSFLITLAFFSFFLLCRYRSFFAHHLKHLLGLAIYPFTLNALSLLLLFLPFLLGLGWMWLFVLWLLIFGAYGTRSERGVIVALLAILFLLPTGVRIHSSLLSSLTGNGIPELIKANTGAWSPDLHRQLLDLKRINPQDSNILQAVGLVEKRMGKFEEAEQHFREWTQLQPHSSAAFNNLGNVYLVTNRIGQAVEAYKKAIQLGPFRAEGHYNLGQAYLLTLHLREAESEFRRARELKPQLISFHTAVSSRNPNRLVIDQTMGLSQLWKRVLSHVPEREKIAQGFWELLWHGVPLKYGEIIVAVLLGLFGLIQIATRNMPLIRRCERCGRLICSGCLRSMVAGNQCSQCINAFAARPSADPQEIKQKRAEVAKHQARRRSIPEWLSLILPGCGHLMRDRSKEGIVFLFIFILFLMKGILWRGWIPDPMVQGIFLSIPWMIVMAILFLFYYGLVQYRMIRLRPKGGKFYFRAA